VVTKFVLTQKTHAKGPFANVIYRLPRHTPKKIVTGVKTMTRLAAKTGILPRIVSFRNQASNLRLNVVEIRDRHFTGTTQVLKTVATVLFKKKNAPVPDNKQDYEDYMTICIAGFVQIMLTCSVKSTLSQLGHEL